MRNKDKYDWDAMPLGEMTDTTLSKMHGIPISTVSNARKRMGIPKFERGPLGKEHFDWSTVAFGTKSDADLGREHGIKASSIGGARRRRGIPTFVEEGKAPPRRAKRGIEWDDETRLGKIPDRELMRLLDLRSSSSVSRARQHRGIPKFVPPTYKQLDAMHKELKAKWNDVDAVEARYKELVTPDGAPERR